MVTKEQIDNFYNKEYSRLHKEANHWLKYCINPTADVEDYISNSYFHLITNKDKIKDEDFIQNFAFRFIIENIKWYNSSTNKQHRRINNGDYELIDEVTEELNLEDELYSLNDNDDYLTKLAAIELYNQQASKEDRIVYQVYANKDKRTVRALGKHLNIKNTQSWVKITQMKTGINQIYNTIKNNDNK